MRLGISYPTLKKWIYSGKLRTVTTLGGRHRVPEAELERFIPKNEIKTGPPRRRNFRRISGRNQLVGRVLEVCPTLRLLLSNSGPTKDLRRSQAAHFPEADFGPA